MSKQLDSVADEGVESAVLHRYGKASRAREAALCCPTSYDPSYLKVLPREIVERDYGCGDPSRFARSGDAVLDLGSGAGKIAYILSQVVGPQGKVVGMDFNEDMLSLARKHQQTVGRRIGWHNVRFCRGRIQDLALDLDALDAWLEQRPVPSAVDLVQLRQQEQRLRRDRPLIADGSVDLIVSNCVLNLVRSEDKAMLFREMVRVLRDGGRVAISDIVSDAEVPEPMRQDPELWSGCISGAFEEEAFIRAFEDAGFHGVAIAEWSAEPFAVEEGIVFRSVTVTAHKESGKQDRYGDRVVLYRGPYPEVMDDAGHVFRRGARVSVSASTLALLHSEPYAGDFIFLEPTEDQPACGKTGSGTTSGGCC